MYVLIFNSCLGEKFNELVFYFFIIVIIIIITVVIKQQGQKQLKEEVHFRLWF